MKYPKSRFMVLRTGCAIIAAAVSVLKAEETRPPTKYPATDPDAAVAAKKSGDRKPQPETAPTRSQQSSPSPAVPPPYYASTAPQIPAADGAANEAKKPAPPLNVRIRVHRSGPPPAGASSSTPAKATPGDLPTGRIRVPMSVVMDSAGVGSTLRALPYTDRGHVMTDLQKRVKATEAALETMDASATEMSEAGRKTFQASASEARSKAEILRTSFRAAREANAAGWTDARAKLAADYEAYADILVRIDVAAGTLPKRP